MSVTPPMHTEPKPSFDKPKYPYQKLEASWGTSKKMHACFCSWGPSHPNCCLNQKLGPGNPALESPDYSELEKIITEGLKRFKEEGKTGKIYLDKEGNVIFEEDETEKDGEEWITDGDKNILREIY